MRRRVPAKPNCCDAAVAKLVDDFRPFVNGVTYIYGTVTTVP